MHNHYLEIICLPNMGHIVVMGRIVTMDRIVIMGRTLRMPLIHLVM
jgi:hypothetical protein